MDLHRLGAVAWTRGRLSAAHRGRQLRTRLWAVTQCAVGAGAAWWLATGVLDHSFAIFAPIVAIICLGITYEQRFNRVVQVMVGATIGVGLAELFAHVVGRGTPQMVVAVLAAMVIAVLLDAGSLIVTQAAVQTSFVTLVEPPDGSIARVVDALVGGLVALAVAVIAPGEPIRKPRAMAADLIRELGTLLGMARTSVRDPERTAEALTRARGTDDLVRDLRGATAEGLDVVAQSPLRRHNAPTVRKIVDVVTPLDRAIRNTRVLIRRIDVGARMGETVPEDYLDLMQALDRATYAIANELAEDRSPSSVRPDLRRVAQASSDATPPPTLSAAVVLGQLRSITIDLLELTGLDHDEAIAAIPPR